jgi:hypothetical protein
MDSSSIARGARSRRRLKVKAQLKRSDFPCGDGRLPGDCRIVAPGALGRTDSDPFGEQHRGPTGLPRAPVGGNKRLRDEIALRMAAANPIGVGV